MTYDPDRDAPAPADVNPNRRPHRRAGAGVSVALMLGLMAAFIMVGFWFYASNDHAPVAVNDLPAQGTTGSNGQGQPPPKR